MIRTSSFIAFSIVLSVGCASTSIRSVDAKREQADIITIRGTSNLPTREVRIEDGTHTTRIAKLVKKIRGSRFHAPVYSFEPGEIQTLTIVIQTGNETETLRMAMGRMLVPDLDHDLFFGSYDDEQDELWKLLVKHLEDSAEPSADKTSNGK